MGQKKIIILVNRDENMDEYVQYGVHLAKDLNRAVTLLDIIDAENYAFAPAGMQNVELLNVREMMYNRMSTTKSRFHKLISGAKKDIPGAPHIDYDIIEGNEVSVIKDISGRNEVDMLMVANENSHHFFSISLTTFQIIQEAKCPVWVVPDDLTYKKFQKLVYATDYSKEDIMTLKKVIDLFGDNHPFISAMHITDDVNFDERIKKRGFLDTLKEQTGYNYLDLKLVKNSDHQKIAELIDEYSSLINADLLILLKENKHFLDRLLSASVTKKMIAESKIPVLVYHEK